MASYFLIFSIFCFNLFSNDYKVELSIPLGQSKINLFNLKTDTIQYYSDDGTFLSGFHFKRTNTSEKIIIRLRVTQKGIMIFSCDTIINKNINSFNKIFKIEHYSESILVSCQFDEIYINKELFLKKETQNDIIKVNQILFPTEYDGFSRSEFVKNKIIIPNNIIYLIKSLFKEQGKDDVYGYVSIEIENKLTQDLTLLAKLDVNKHKEYFIPRNIVDKHYENVSISNLKIKGKSSSILRLPLYVDEDNIKSGNYDFTIELNIFGSNDIIYQKSISFYCEKKSAVETYFFVSYLLISLVGIYYLVKIYRKEILNFNLRIFTTIALFSSLNFMLTYAALFIDSTIFSLLGPYKIFLTSLITEFISYLIIFTTVILFPKKGIISLLLIVQYLLVTAFYSSFFIHQLLFLFFKIILLESVLIFAKQFKISASAILFAIILGLTDVVLKHYILLESSILFRLYYADWYIVSYLIIVGFFYTFLAVRLANLLVKPIRNIVYYV
jgi:hypothetical protein